MNRPEPSNGFDWASIEPPSTDSPVRLAGDAMGDMLRWVAEPVTSGHPQRTASVRNRALALAWAINPRHVGGLSAAALARRLGITPRAFTRFTAEARVRFGLLNTFHRHDWRRRLNGPPRAATGAPASPKKSGKVNGSFPHPPPTGDAQGEPFR